MSIQTIFHTLSAIFSTYVQCKSFNLSTVIPKKQVGRSLMLNAIDQKVQNFLMILRSKGGVVNKVVANATAETLIDQSQEEYLKSIDLEKSS